MKKGSYWFAFLSEKEQEKFRENLKKQGKDFDKYLEDKYKEFYIFIGCSFNWSKTKQHHDYWEEISNRSVQ